MSGSSSAAPYWRLSLFYLAYFAAVGCFVGYWALYLEGEGYSAKAIGQLMAIVAASRVFAPYLWGWLADHTGQQISLIRIAALTAALAFLGVYLADGFWLMAAVMLLFSFFWNACLPQFEVTTLRLLAGKTHRYSHIRLWGSIGFIILVLGLGPLLDRWGVDTLPHVLILLFTCIWIATLSVPVAKQQRTATIAKQAITKILLQHKVFVVLLLCFLMQLSFGAYYAFFSVYLQDYGYSKAMVGVFWALGAFAEIFVFLVMHHLLPRFGAKSLLFFCFAITAFRWWVISVFVDNIMIMVLAQLLHAFSFGMFHAVMIYLIHNLFPAEHQGRGQALYSSISFGAGGALGALISGYLLDWRGGEAVFLLAAVIALIGFVLVALLPREQDLAQQAA